MLNMSVIGRLVKDAECSNEYSISFTVAVNFYDSIAKEQDAIFIKCYLDKNQNKNMQKFLTKGNLFYFNLTPIKIGVYNEKASIMARVNTFDFTASKPSELTESNSSESIKTPVSEKAKKLMLEDEKVPWA